MIPTLPPAVASVSPDPLASWETKPSSGDQFACLDGIRGLAILLVVACHAVYANPDGGRLPKLIASIVGRGSMGVEVFFALSGFVISYPFFLRKAKQEPQWMPPGYFTRRFWRIYPPLLLSMAFFVVFYHFADGDTMIREAGMWLIGWPHIVPTQMHFNPVIWSLVIEVQFYLTLPLLFLATRSATYWRATSIMIAVLLVAPILVRELTTPRHPDALHLAFFFRRYPGFLNCFAWGMLVASSFAWARVRGQAAQFTARSRVAWIGWAVLGLTFIVSGVLNYVLPGEENLNRWWLEATVSLPAISAFFLLHYVWNPSSFGARILARPALRWLGLVSYEWYLFHQPVIYWFRDLVGSAQGNLIQYVWHIGAPSLATLGLAALVYRFFSLPILRAHRGIKRPVKNQILVAA